MWEIKWASKFAAPRIRKYAAAQQRRRAMRRALMARRMKTIALGCTVAAAADAAADIS
jgi:hypothetical protein